jgi:hypothetical protein
MQCMQVADPVLPCCTGTDPLRTCSSCLLSCQRYSTFADFRKIPNVQHATSTANTCCYDFTDSTRRYQANPYGATLLSVNGHRPTMAPAVMAAITLQLDRIIATLKTGALRARACVCVCGGGEWTSERTSACRAGLDCEAVHGGGTWHVRITQLLAACLLMLPCCQDSAAPAR